MKSKQENSCKQQSFGLIDFLIGIAQECFFANGDTASPYDVNFTNHCNALYEFDKSAIADGKTIPNKVTMDKKSKSVTAEFDMRLNKSKENAVKEYCPNNDIDYDIQEGRLKSVTIKKTTTNVTDDRCWDKEIK